MSKSRVRSHDKNRSYVACAVDKMEVTCVTIRACADIQPPLTLNFEYHYQTPKYNRHSPPIMQEGAIHLQTTYFNFPPNYKLPLKIRLISSYIIQNFPDYKLPQLNSSSKAKKHFQHGMSLRDRSTPKPKPAGTISTADNKSNKASKANKAVKNTRASKANKINKNNNTNKASKNNKASKPKKIMARYIFAPAALQTLRLYKGKSNAQFVEGYLKRLRKQKDAPEEGIEITASVSEEFEFLGWTKGMIFRDIKFAARMGMELDDSEFRMKWDGLE
ncbi:hypothetical protein FPQ18DRAFT_306935 [Pyronema domesticum]|nr:hypothetical protein FPQ18DRAFT_306935 [Pyronema domesticum]